MRAIRLRGAAARCDGGVDTECTAEIGDSSIIRKIYEKRRWRLFLWLILGYGFFYTCRLSLSVAKKPMLDDGVMSVEQMGIIGSLLFFVYAFGKFFNGFLADRANIRRFMSVALFEMTAMLPPRVV